MLGLKNALEKIAIFKNHEKIGAIGVDFSLEEMHLVQLKRSDDVISLHAKASIPYPGTRDELLTSYKELKTVWQKAKKLDNFSGHKVVTVLPAGKARVMSISYPHNRTQDVNHEIFNVLQERLSCDLSEYVIDYLPVRGSEQDANPMAITAIVPRNDVLNHLHVLRKAGMDVEALEIGPSAIKRLVISLANDKQHENVLVINFGQKMSYLTILSGRRLIFDQEVDFGEQAILEKMSKVLDMDHRESRNLLSLHGLKDINTEDDWTDGEDIVHTLRQIVTPLFMRLAEEINRLLIYTASETRGEPVSKILMVGSIARWAGSDNLLSSILNIQVRTIPDPLQPFRTGEDNLFTSSHGVPELAIATGMALRGVIDE